MNATNKIKTLQELSIITAQLKEEGKIICHCHGVFDVLHIGHHRHFKMAKAKGDVLVVTLSPDEFVDKGNGRPIFSENLRLEQIADLEFVDFVALNETKTAVEAIKLLKANFFCKGEEFADGQDDITKIGAIKLEQEAIESIGGKIYYTPTGMSNISSTKIANAHLNVFSDEQKKFLSQVKKHFGLSQILNLFEEFKKLRILLLGESIMDTYIYALPLGKSVKDNNICVNPVNTEKFAGGVISCANIMANLCNQVDIITIADDNDINYDWLRRQLNPNVNCHLFSDKHSSIIERTRYLDASYYHKLFETISVPDDRMISVEIEKKFLHFLVQNIKEYDIVAVMDYGYNLMTANIRDYVINHAGFLAVCTETNSFNIGFNLLTDKYYKADFICLDEQEAKLTTHNWHDEMIDITNKLLETVNCRQMTITLGHKGSITRDQTALITIPTFSTKVIDTTSADDAYFAIASLCAKTNTAAILTGFIGNITGALAVAIMGSQKNISALSIRKFIKTLMQ